MLALEQKICWTRIYSSRDLYVQAMEQTRDEMAMAADEIAREIREMRGE